MRTARASVQREVIRNKELKLWWRKCKHKAASAPFMTAVFIRWCHFLPREVLEDPLLQAVKEPRQWV